MNSRTALFLAAAAILHTVLFFPRWDRPGTEATIAWDVSGYYLYLPATIIYADLEKLAFLPGLLEKYGLSGDQAFPTENGNLVMKYPAGMALLYLPFFLIAHAVASLSDFPADGFSLPYQIAVQMGGALMAILGLFFLRKILRRYFADHLAGWAILLIALGTNFFNYATFDSGNVHVWSFALLAMLTYLTLLWHEKPTWPRALGIGACIGMAALVRPTELLFALVPVLWGIGNWAALRAKFELCKKHFPQLLGAALVVAAIGSIQLFYWKSVSGNWLVYSYQDQGFSFLRPHFADVFFSYRKGWFVYTPLMLFAVAGLFFLGKNLFWGNKNEEGTPPYILPVLGFFAINTWVIASWDIWWYGGAFGQRALIASYVLLAFPLAALMGWALKKRWSAITFWALAAAFTLLNLFQTYQAHWGPWEALDMNRAYYWRIFANTENDIYDRILLDTNLDFKGEKKNEKSIFKANLNSPADSTGLSQKLTRSSAFSLAVNSEIEYSQTLVIPRSPEMAPGKWLAVSGWYAKDEHAPSFWHMPQFIVRFFKNGEMTGAYFFRPNRILLTLDDWKPLTVDLPIPAIEFDQIHLFLWRPQPFGSLYADEVEVKVFE